MPSSRPRVELTKTKRNIWAEPGSTQHMEPARAWGAEIKFSWKAAAPAVGQALTMRTCSDDNSSAPAAAAAAAPPPSSTPPRKRRAAKPSSPWDATQEQFLRSMVTRHGRGDWNAKASCLHDTFGVKRTGGALSKKWCVPCAVLPCGGCAALCVHCADAMPLDCMQERPVARHLRRALLARHGGCRGGAAGLLRAARRRRALPRGGPPAAGRGAQGRRPCSRAAARSVARAAARPAAARWDVAAARWASRLVNWSVNRFRA